MKKYEEIKAASKRLKEQFPNIAYGVGVNCIEVRVQTKEEALKLPKTFEGYTLNVEVTGQVRAL